MEIMVSNCNVLYEDWQIQCCGEEIKVNDEVIFCLQNHNPRLMGGWMNIDFDENHHDIINFELKGKVISIKAIFEDVVAESRYYDDPRNIYHPVEIQSFDGWEEFPGYENFKKERPSFYLLSIENAIIKPDNPYDKTKEYLKDKFEIELLYFSYGWLEINLIFNGIKIPFNASYNGPDPIGDLITSLDILESPSYDTVISYAKTCWVSEPGEMEIEFERFISEDKLNIYITIDEDPKKKWEIKGISYQLFKKEVLRCVCEVLTKYGMVGYSMTWKEDCYNFPVTSLMKIIVNQSYNMNSDDVLLTNYKKELHFLTKFLDNGISD